MQPLLQLENIHLTLGERKVIDGLNLSVARGEVHALLGANGAGKSTVAFMIMGREGYRPENGELRFEGEPLLDLPMHERARRGITLAWQEPARFEGLTAADYLMLGDGKVKPAQALKQVGLDPAVYLARPVDKTLSGGERKRIELAAVLAMGTKLAILDEPAAGIDLLSLDEISQVIVAMKQAGSAVLLITHREDMAVHVDRASQLCGGRIVCHGAPDTVIANYKARHCGRCDGETCGYA
ncbi:ABC transporter ATP-binding protein [Thiohalophilus sp.]|uniref:ABC transporter ATP-binding protein n=1 Tax=Thiohalophilus sp. TaxID=3028392 RepID=UPI002ACEB1CC|nr:ABC transporter ATP-binding protein [Thiohalophilus sp.]MDZ7802693.1 ABC transporter ATP-binding protein [Thiohalophilus sp.]